MVVRDKCRDGGGRDAAVNSTRVRRPDEERVCTGNAMAFLINLSPDVRVTSLSF